jgi:hypothetical protein
MPSHANGYVRSNTWYASPGIAERAMPCDPSHPATIVAFDLARDAAGAKANARPVRVDVVKADVFRFEADLSAGRDTRGDEILHHLVLAVPP